MNVNAIVSCNLRAIRERRGWTQEMVAERLGQLTGHKLPQASISGMERGYDSGRRRRFDAHDLYLLSTVFDVPIAYFFLPPPRVTFAELANTRRPVAELYSSLFGQESQLRWLDERLTELRDANPDADQAMVAVIGEEAVPEDWNDRFDALARTCLAVADVVAAFAAAIRAIGPLACPRAAAQKSR